MNDPILAGYVFNPSARTIDFSAVPGFSFSRLFGIEHKPSGQFLYLAATPELTPTINGAVLTLDPTIDLTGMAANDPLSFRYDPLPGIQTGDANGALAVGGVAAPVAANPARKFIEITNTGPNPLTYRWGAAATATIGHILGAGQTVRYGRDGGVPVGALNLFSTGGTTFFVTTG
jgi:hypothetical protein